MDNSPVTSMEPVYLDCMVSYVNHGRLENSEYDYYLQHSLLIQSPKSAPAQRFFSMF